MFSAEGVYQLLAFKFRLFEPHGRKCLEFGPNCPPAIEHGLLENPPALVDDFPSYIYVCNYTRPFSFLDFAASHV